MGYTAPQLPPAVAVVPSFPLSIICRLVGSIRLNLSGRALAGVLVAHPQTEADTLQSYKTVHKRAHSKVTCRGNLGELGEIDGLVELSEEPSTQLILLNLNTAPKEKKYRTYICSPSAVQKMKSETNSSQLLYVVDEALARAVDWHFGYGGA